MRVLLSSSRGAGHFLPLVPFGRAAERRGDEVLVAGPPALAPMAEEAGFAFWPVDAPPEDELGAVWGRVPALPPDRQNQIVVREIFARLNAGAALPRLNEACERWRPDLVLREQNEYGAALAAELHNVAHARVGIGLAAAEEMSLRHAPPALDALRRAAGLPPDPDGEHLRGSPYLTLFPASLEDPAAPGQPNTIRARDPAWDDPWPPLPAWWERPEPPLVYVTFGTVAGGIEEARQAYALALAAVARLDARVLFTVGQEADLGLFAGAPTHVHVERWIAQGRILAEASAVICHGGSGSTLGALAAGVPLVVMPLFADQPTNAARVEAIGAGLAVTPPDAEALTAAMGRVLAEDGFRARAEAVAAELRATPPADAALAALLDRAA
jgi:UDP:flavonoid glycosyltransferase YjiC (YdhE family)